ncbi:MAG TPA: RsmE family RNA methyltransferase [Saprospiraceae bacterium]|nr:RsmE family RNA methyltransferase [Saprospiraceae bacterium]
MQLFWGKNIGNERIYLDKDELRHLTRSLRKRAGQHVQIIDGSGQIFTSELLTSTANDGLLKIITQDIMSPKWQGRIHLAIGLTKNTERIEWFVEKAVEIGIDEISFINSRNSERTHIRTERIENIVRSAMKQSTNVFLPQLHFELPFNQLFKEKTPTLIASCLEIEKKTLKEAILPGIETRIIIGPEGDFTLDEINLALAKGAEIISLGNSRLRTETAGIYALSVYHHINLV